MITDHAMARSRAHFDPRTVISFAIPGGFLLLVVILAVFAPLIAPFDPTAQAPANRLRAPTTIHLMGTDEFGRDILSRIIFGARTSVAVGLAAVAASAVVGTAIGMLAGYLGGWADEASMRVMDVIIAFPSLVLAIAIVAVAGSSVVNVIIVIAIVQLPVFARLARASALATASTEYLTAARVLGVGAASIVMRHLFPNVIAPSVTMVGLMLADAILIESALSFLGLGVVPPTPSWGNILAAGRDFILLGTWWFMVFPGLAIFLTVLAINIAADLSRDRLDPTTRAVR